MGDVARVQELIASGADVETRNPEVGPSQLSLLLLGADFSILIHDLLFR